MVLKKLPFRKSARRSNDVDDESTTTDVTVESEAGESTTGGSIRRFRRTRKAAKYAAVGVVGLVVVRRIRRRRARKAESAE